MTRDSLVGQHPVQRLGSLMTGLGLALGIYELIVHSDITSRYWISSLAKSIGGALTCGLPDYYCLESSGWVLAVWAVCLGLLLRFSFVPVWRWLHAGSRQP